MGRRAEEVDVIKMGVFYRPPDDPETFEKRYVDEHLPMVRGYPNIKKATAYKVSRSVMGEFPYAYVFSGTWDDLDGWKADMRSEEAAKAAEHAKQIAPPFDVVVLEELG